MRCLVLGVMLVLYFSTMPYAEVEKDTIKLASWNIRIFSNSRTDEELRAICKIAQQFDFIAISELRDVDVLQRMVAMLKSEFNRSYSYDVSPYVGSTDVNDIVKEDRSRELYAFVYDNTIISQVKAGSLFQDSTFFRYPYYASFRAGHFDFTAIIIHVIWGSTVAQRRKEINRLAYVYQTIQDADAQENDVILLGDFNRAPDDDLAWGPIKSISSMLHLFDPPSKSMIWDTELYDNLWFQSIYTKEFTLDRGIVHFDESDFGNNDDAASAAVSDHRPVWGLFRMYSGDDD